MNPSGRLGQDNYSDFNVKEFSSELDTLVKANAFRPFKKEEALNRDVLSQNSERYKELLNYTIERPEYDANKDQKLFDEYMTHFREEIEDQDKFRS